VGKCVLASSLVAKIRAGAGVIDGRHIGPFDVLI
jgi:hypothetical protein